MTTTAELTTLTNRLEAYRVQLVSNPSSGIAASTLLDTLDLAFRVTSSPGGATPQMWQWFVAARDRARADYDNIIGRSSGVPYMPGPASAPELANRWIEILRSRIYAYQTTPSTATRAALQDAKQGAQTALRTMASDPMAAPLQLMIDSATRVLGTGGGVNTPAVVGTDGGTTAGGGKPTPDGGSSTPTGEQTSSKLPTSTGRAPSGNTGLYVGLAGSLLLLWWFWRKR